MTTSGRDEREKSYVGDEETAEEFLAAARAGDMGQVEEMLAADPGLVRVTDSVGGTAVHEAAYRGHTAVVRRLLAAAPELLHAETKSGWQPAHLAAWWGHADVLAVLIERGARVNAQTEAGRTPLHEAAECGSEACVRVLLTAAPGLARATDSLGWTAVHAAAYHGHTAVVRLLLAAAPELLHAKTKLGWQPAHLAAWGGEADVLAVLMERGARVDAQDEAGWTPLHRAVGCNSEACVRVLLAAGARVDVKNNSGQTGRDLAEVWGRSNIVALLEAHEKSTRNHKPAETVPSAGDINIQHDANSATASRPIGDNINTPLSTLTRIPTTCSHSMNLNNIPQMNFGMSFTGMHEARHQMPDEMGYNASYSSIENQAANANPSLSSQVTDHMQTIQDSVTLFSPVTSSFSLPETHHQTGHMGASVSQAAGNAAADEDSATTSVPTAAVAQNPTNNPAAGDQHTHSDPSMVSIDTAPSNVDIVDTAPFNVEMDSSDCMVYVPEAAPDPGEHTLMGMSTHSRVAVPEAAAQEQAPPRGQSTHSRVSDPREQGTPMGTSTRGLQTKVAKKRPPQWTEQQQPNRAGAPQARLHLLCELCESLTDDFASHLVREHGADRSEAERLEQHEREQAVTTYNETRMVDPAWLEREMRGAVLSYNGLVRILRQLGHHVTARRREPAAAAGSASTLSASHQPPTPPTLQQRHQHAPVASASFLNRSDQSSADDHIPLKKRKTFEPGQNIAHQEFCPMDQHDDNAQDGNCGRTAASGSLHRRPGKFSFTIPYGEWKDNVKDLVYSKNSRHCYFTNVSKVFRTYFSEYCDCNIKMKNNFFKHTKTPNFEAKFVCKQNCSHYIATVDKLEENFPVVFNVQRTSIDDQVIHRNS